MKKRIIGLLLALLLLACASALAEEPKWSYDNGNMYLKLDGNLSGDVTVPSEVDGYSVNAISGSFYGQSEVTSLTMPDSLRAIKDGAISQMDGLTSVTLNDGLEYIGDSFSSCNALTSVTVPASVRIVDGAFSNCANLKEIRFEGACPMFIGPEWCFFMMPEDYVIYVPDDQLDAYAAALKDANGAADRLQPSGKSAVIPEEENSEDWFTFDAATGAITGYREYHAYVEIPETIGGVPVKSVAENAFRSDYSIYGIVFPEGLEHIDAGAFAYASSLAYVKFPATLKTIGDDAFFNAQIDRIDWSEGLEEIGARAFQYDKAAILSLPETVKTIGESAFEGSWCQELYLGGNVESIGSRAFAGTALNYLVFDLYAPIDIAPDAFVETNVADLDLPWDSSFENRDAYAELLKDQCPDCTVWINNPDSAGVAEYPVNETEITTIEDGVWTVYNGSQADLTVWTAYDDINVTALGDGLFKGNQTIRSFYPHHCGWFTTIGAEAFADSSVEYVELFGSITEIGDEAFRSCTNITELTLPSSLTSIGSGAFRGCTGITELTLPASLTSIGAGALEGCTGLEKLTVCCDPAILPEDMADVLANINEVYISADATVEQVRQLSALVGRPWYDPVPREGEPQSRFAEMPYEPLPGDDFWYDEEYSRLDAYQGYELNLILPREIDGVQLTMIGGGMMNRAAYGDNYEVELPVVSVVIPENYTEIPAYAFSNCDALETVICYAPIENLADGTFKGCTNLREIVFVNGVRSLGDNVFSDCLSLETVYLGAYVENVSETAFQDEYGVEYCTYADCITDPAQLPNVDALLAAVKCDPMPEPTPAPTPEPARPVGAEGEPFFGEWNGVSMEMDGSLFSFDDFGMVMTLTLSEDGIAALFDGEETDSTSWKVEDGVAIIDTMRGSIQPDGALCLEEDGAKLYFTRGTAASGAETVATPEPEVTEPASDGMAAYIGTWHACYLVTGGMTGDPRSAFNLDIVLELNADGTGSLTFPEPEAHVWYQDAESGAVFFGEGGDAPDMPLTLLEDGFLQYGSTVGDGNALGGCIIFSQDPNAVWTPEFADEPPVSATESPSAPVTAADGSAEDRLERKFICTSADINGYAMDAAMLGGEYSMTFHADGTMDFIMVGTSISGLVWTQGVVQTDAGEAAAFLVDYYGNTLEAVWTEEGFDMNYFDSMLMHFAPEA
ncbi:MAG: leucine-rich repeat protein [Candidatus Faecivicinus sp.]